ncbi:uncharacterized protein J3D65DRAFT_104173 [Phyllosticta citribraziliensis]|uniref:Uncharacterized protein n=1 Tax=Phyllosticta citribraziliensis TaxID=989973 RepID=A0ABR1LAW9_9PEZI
MSPRLVRKRARFRQTDRQTDLFCLPLCALCGLLLLARNTHTLLHINQTVTIIILCLPSRVHKAPAACLTHPSIPPVFGLRIFCQPPTSLPHRTTTCPRHPAPVSAPSPPRLRSVPGCPHPRYQRHQRHERQSVDLSACLSSIVNRQSLAAAALHAQLAPEPEPFCPEPHRTDCPLSAPLPLPLPLPADGWMDGLTVVGAVRAMPEGAR